tara:strand:- start:108 stop:668 length:561 start_codon:yes stop_codon:yes gene_type:complete
MNDKEKIINKLRKSAMSYLARYEVSVHQFENTMKRKLSNLRANLDNLDEIRIINTLKNEMVLAKFIDDKRFTETKIRSIRRQGGSERYIYAKLKEKGVSNNIIKCAIETIDEGHENAEMIAALNFIKKKNIGVYYKKKLENKIDEFEVKKKWYGALSRRGFSLDIVNKIFEIKDIEKANLILEDNL